MFLELLKKYNDQYDIKIFAYCLMPDHLHLLIEMINVGKAEAGIGKSQEMSEFMQNLNNAYTKYFNSRYDRQGHLFRERFKAAVVEKKNYLLKMTVYMHLNPQKLNFTPDARTYPYSSLPAYLDNQPAGGLDLKNEIAEIFSLLGNKTYDEFINEMNPEDGEFLHKRLARGGILGSDEFVQKVREEIEAYQSADHQAVLQPAHRYRLLVTTASVVLVFAAGLTAGTYFYFVHKKPTAMQSVSPIPEGIRGAGDLENTEWLIQLTPVAGGKAETDAVTFANGTFISAQMDFQGFTRSNYSITQESNGKLVWETMQTQGTNIASWRGEIEEGKMQGILSLRREGKPAQDFSFMSIKYKRKGI
jgi:REP element-mobilizing transposase RayT